MSTNASTKPAAARKARTAKAAPTESAKVLSELAAGMARAAEKAGVLEAPAKATAAKARKATKAAVEAAAEAASTPARKAQAERVKADDARFEAASKMGTQTCRVCARELPATKFPTKAADAAGRVLREDRCRECRDAARSAKAAPAPAPKAAKAPRKAKAAKAS
jgi:hypothetical protein